MKTLKHGLDRFLAFVCIVDFIVMVLLTVYQVVVRYVFKSPSSVSEVLTRYCFVWLILLSATYVFGQRDHICITYLKDKLNGSTKRLLDAAIEVVIILFSALILVYGGSVITTMNMLQYDSILKIPTGTIYSIIPVCGVLIIFYSIYNLTVELNKKEGGGVLVSILNSISFNSLSALSKLLYNSSDIIELWSTFLLSPFSFDGGV